MFIELHGPDGLPITINADYLSSFMPDSSVSGANSFVTVIGATVDYIEEEYDDIKRLMFGDAEDKTEGGCFQSTENRDRPGTTH